MRSSLFWRCKIKQAIEIELTIVIYIKILVIHCYQKCVSSLITDTGQALHHNVMNDFPANCRILAYKGYPNDYPLVTPLGARQLVSMNAVERASTRYVNSLMCNRRVFVEHMIK